MAENTIYDSLKEGKRLVCQVILDLCRTCDIAEHLIVKGLESWPAIPGHGQVPVMSLLTLGMVRLSS